MPHQKKNQRGYQRIHIFFIENKQKKKVIVIACVIKININNCMNGETEIEQEKNTCITFIVIEMHDQLN